MTDCFKRGTRIGGPPSQTIRNTMTQLLELAGDGHVSMTQLQLAAGVMFDCADQVERLEAMAVPESQRADPKDIENGSPNIVPVWYWTDANDWVATADPNEVPLIEVGFLDGEEEPALFVQDNPTVGSMFNSDKLTWKMRHIYGAVVSDFRGAYKAVVI